MTGFHMQFVEKREFKKKAIQFIKMYITRELITQRSEFQREDFFKLNDLTVH